MLLLCVSKVNAKNYICVLGWGDLNKEIYLEYQQALKSTDQNRISYWSSELLREEYNFKYNTSKCKNGDTIHIYQKYENNLATHSIMPYDYNYQFNNFIANNCNFKYSILSKYYNTLLVNITGINTFNQVDNAQP